MRGFGTTPASLDDVCGNCSLQPKSVTTRSAAARTSSPSREGRHYDRDDHVAREITRTKSRPQARVVVRHDGPESCATMMGRSLKRRWSFAAPWISRGTLFRQESRMMYEPAFMRKA